MEILSTNVWTMLQSGIGIHDVVVMYLFLLLQLYDKPPKILTQWMSRSKMSSWIISRIIIGLHISYLTIQLELLSCCLHNETIRSEHTHKYERVWVCIHLSSAIPCTKSDVDTQGLNNCLMKANTRRFSTLQTIDTSFVKYKLWINIYGFTEPPKNMLRSSEAPNNYIQKKLTNIPIEYNN